MTCCPRKDRTVGPTGLFRICTDPPPGSDQIMMIDHVHHASILALVDVLPDRTPGRDRYSHPEGQTLTRDGTMALRPDRRCRLNVDRPVGCPDASRRMDEISSFKRCACVARSMVPCGLQQPLRGRRVTCAVPVREGSRKSRDPAQRGRAPLHPELAPRPMRERPRQRRVIVEIRRPRAARAGRVQRRPAGRHHGTWPPRPADCGVLRRTSTDGAAGRTVCLSQFDAIPSWSRKAR